MTSRLFLAVEMDADAVARWDESIAPLAAVAPGLAWVPPAKRHLTLKFLGDVDDARKDEMIAMAESVAEKHRPFSINLHEIGAFPNFRRARVVWIGVEQDPRLELLHHDVEVAAERQGFEIEGRAFRPHITVARVRTAPGDDVMRRLSRAARKVDLTTTVAVAGVTLFESTLLPSGARYTRLHVAKLGG